MYTARLDRNIIQVFDVKTGAIKRSLTLPPGTYDSLVISGDNVTVTVHTKYTGDRIITFNMKTGNKVSEFGM